MVRSFRGAALVATGLLGCGGATGLLGCGGGAPLLHPAHVLGPGMVSVGAGLSGQVAVTALPAATDASNRNASPLRQLTVAPGVAPWVSARVGLADSSEGGLTYTARAIRADLRHAFRLGAPTLSVGLGASVIVAHRASDGLDVSAVYGGGGDLPILIGVQSRGDLYALWFGPRAGFELLSGQLQLATDTPGTINVVEARGQQVYAGLVAGMRVGFRHIHAALELDASFHHVSGDLGGVSTSLDQLALTPGGALLVSF